MVCETEQMNPGSSIGRPSGSEDPLLPGQGRSSQRVRRSLVFPSVIAGLAVVTFAWLLTRSPASTEIAAPPTTAATTTTELELEPGVDPPDADERGSFRLLGAARDPGRRVAFMQLSLNRSRPIDTNVHIVDDGDLRSIELSESLQALGRIDNGMEHAGEIRAYILTLEHGVLFTNRGRVSHQQVLTGAEPTDLGRGFSFFRGPDTSSAWILGSAERSARLVSISETGEVVELRQLDLGDLGRPVDAVGDRLILGLLGTDPDNGFGVSAPDGYAPITETQGLTYLGAGADVVVFGDGDELLLKSLSDPTRPGRRVTVSSPSLHRTRVSPDGRLLVASVVTDLTEPNRLVIFDLETGQELDRVSSAVEIAFRWSSPTSVVYLRPDWPEVDLVEREIDTGIDRNLVHFDDLSWWFSVLPRDGDTGS